MRNIYTLTTAIVLIGVVAVVWAGFSNKTVIDEDFVVVQDFVTWKMGSGDFLLTAPGSWDVRQYDAGGGSLVTVRSDASESGLDVVVTIGQEFFSSEPIDFETWLRTETAGKSTCDARTIGGIAMQCFSDVDGTVSTYGQREDDRFAALFFTVSDRSDGNQEYDAVLNSLDFMPSEAALAEAQVIP